MEAGWDLHGPLIPLISNFVDLYEDIVYFLPILTARVPKKKQKRPGAPKFCWQGHWVGCRPPGGNLRYSAQRTIGRQFSPKIASVSEKLTCLPSRVPHCLLCFQTVQRIPCRLSTLPRFLKLATERCCTRRGRGHLFRFLLFPGPARFFSSPHGCNFCRHTVQCASLELCVLPITLYLPH